MSVFLLEEEGKKALFDIDLNEKTSKGIPDRLKRAQGFRRWNWLYAKDNIYFKNAKAYVSKEEYDGWINKMPTNKNGLQFKTIKIIEKQLVKFDFNDSLPLGIKPIKSFGHTPGHTCSRRDDLIIIKDLIHSQDIKLNILKFAKLMIMMER